MDYVGQKLVEQLYFNILLVFAAIGFCCGYIAQDFDVAFQIACIGILVCLIVTVPDWSCFNRNPLPWRKPVKQDQGKTASKISLDEVKEGHALLPNPKTTSHKGKSVSSM